MADADGWRLLVTVGDPEVAAQVRTEYAGHRLTGDETCLIAYVPSEAVAEAAVAEVVAIAGTKTTTPITARIERWHEDSSAWKDRHCDESSEALDGEDAEDDAPEPGAENPKQSILGSVIDSLLSGPLP